jgi:hypothetical protein
MTVISFLIDNRSLGFFAVVGAAIAKAQQETLTMESNKRQIVIKMSHV